VKDPHIQQVEVMRLRCKRCGRAVRQYPQGVRSGRQSDAVLQLSVLFHGLGLTYEVVRCMLQLLGCTISATTIRHNVEWARRFAEEPLDRSRLQLELGSDGRLRGPDGVLGMRVIGTPERRWLEVEISPGLGAAELRWRVEHCARHLLREPIEVSPPESV
jgi:hypothetical protein